MRAFIALEIPEEIKKEIGEIQNQLKKLGLQARWVNPKITHLTLAFLGSITPDKIVSINKILKEGAGEINSIHLYLLKLACFPNSTKARVIFIDLGGELEKLNTLATKIRNLLKGKGIWFDKKLSITHITLARIKKIKDLRGLVEKIKIPKKQFIGQEVYLIKSTLTPNGPVYQTLQKASLLRP